MGTPPAALPVGGYLDSPGWSRATARWRPSVSRLTAIANRCGGVFTILLKEVLWPSTRKLS
jgi:hypothetical protein